MDETNIVNIHLRDKVSVIFKNIENDNKKIIDLLNERNSLLKEILTKSSFKCVVSNVLDT